MTTPTEPLMCAVTGAEGQGNYQGLAAEVAVAFTGRKGQQVRLTIKREGRYVRVRRGLQQVAVFKVAAASEEGQDEGT